MTATPTTMDRREILALVLASAVTAALPGYAGAVGAATPGAATPAAARRLAALLDSFAEEILRLSPQAATSLGVDNGSRRRLKSELDDASADGEARWKAQVESMLTRLAKVDPAQLPPPDQAHLQTVRYAAMAGTEGTRFSYGGGAGSGFRGGTSPYIVSQQAGALVRVPEFLDSHHAISDASDAEAYLERVEALARVLDEESARITQHAARAVMPPSFIAATTLGQLTGFRRTPVAEQKLVRSLVSRARAQGIKGDWEERVTRMVASRVYPALDRQIAAFAKSTAAAPDTAGVDRLPDGEAYYHWALKLGTTTAQSPAEIHATGLEQNQEIQARMDAILRARGMTQGSVGARVQSLNSDPRQLFPDTDPGRESLIAYCNDRIAAVRALMPRFSHLTLQAPLRVRRVPADIQDGAPLGYMNRASLDGKRPATYYINLKSTSLWPKYQIPTLTAHEGLPGHTWQGAYLTEHYREIPLICQLMGFNAFIEGWALYAEQSVDELGFYADDPLGQIGYLQAQQFRACRMVVDTGLHALRWTRAQAIDFLASETGKGRDAATSEIDRYCASPGQACGYKAGHNEILKQRERARAALGTRFDLAAFNDMLVETGGVPLALLGAPVDRFIAAS